MILLLIINLCKLYNCCFFRPGASSGILLGAVTLPTVMLSRLIQASRALSVNDIELEGKDFDFHLVRHDSSSNIHYQ